jgi:hypothetical protein
MVPGSSMFGLTKEQLSNLAKLRVLNSEQTNLPPYDEIQGMLRKLGNYAVGRYNFVEREMVEKFSSTKHFVDR